MGYASFIYSGQAFTVPDRTPVVVIGSGFGTKQIRILDGPHAGKAGWIPYEWLK